MHFRHYAALQCIPFILIVSAVTSGSLSQRFSIILIVINHVFGHLSVQYIIYLFNPLRFRSGQRTSNFRPNFQISSCKTMLKNNYSTLNVKLMLKRKKLCSIWISSAYSNVLEPVKTQLHHSFFLVPNFIMKKLKKRPIQILHLLKKNSKL